MRGERRWRAARMAGLDRVPCIIREMDVPTQMEIALVENLQREDLNPIEAAQGIQTLMRQCGYTQEAVAARLCKSRPAVANLLRLLTLPEDIITMVRQGTLSAGHARVLAGLESDEMKMTLARQTITNEWSVRQLENAVALMRKSTPTLPKNTAEGAFSACGADGAGNVLPRDVRRSRDDYRQSEEGQNHAAVLLGGGAGAGL